MNTNIPLDFKMFMYLGYIISVVKVRDRNLMSALLVAGKKALTRGCMMHPGPTINNWIDVTVENYKIERGTFSVNLKMDILL